MPRVYHSDFPVFPTLKGLILDGFERGGDKPLFVFRTENDGERTKTFREVREDTFALGAFLMSEGIGKGSHVAILSENRYFWNVAYYASVCAGCTVIPLDTGLTAEDIYRELADCGAEALFYSPEQAAKAEYARSKNVPELTRYYCAADEESFYAAGKAAPEDCLDRFVNAEVGPEDIACVVYTSGTTGKTKGVMLTHKNICADVYSLLHINTGGHGIGFLPLNHTYSWVTGLFAALVKSEWGYICTDLNRIYKDIKEYRPYQFAAVPMVVEMIYQNIIMTAKRKGNYEKLMRGIEMSRNFMLSGYDARREIFSEIHESLGGNLECIFCGGAYLSPETEEFMFDIGIRIVTGYGLTECSPCVTCSGQYEYKFGSAGLPLDCCEIKIKDPDPDGIGEILVRGDNVFPGYYNDPEATAAAFDGEWLKTGDYGYIDDEGYLWFTGRKKNLIVLSNGKNVSPEVIEGRLTSVLPYVKEAVVSDKNNRIFAEVFLDETAEPDAREMLPDGIRQVNEGLADFMRITGWEIRDTEFPKTTTLKIKRQYADAPH